uniref:Uncharacterized protein n=1 Tax=Anopheles funestus TaxID=62324 RepID=A0A182S268_ANOFN
MRSSCASLSVAEEVAHSRFPFFFFLECSWT